MMTEPIPEIIVLVPAYREELTISMVVTLSLKYADKVIVVDDGSPDRTSELAKAAGAEVIKQEPNQGKAAALKRGFEACLALKPKCVIMIDGDGQMDPGQIPLIAGPILKGETDMVIGSRFIGESQDIPRYRRFGQHLLNRATNLGGDIKITDSQSGYRGLSLKALQNMDFQSESYNVESDMIIHFVQIGLKIIEVPINVRYDVPNGHKQHPVKHGMSVLARMISYIGYKRPLVVFGIPGVVVFCLGLFMCFETYLQVTIFFQWSLVTQGLAGVSLFGIGVFLIFASLILNSLGILMQTIMNNMKK